MDYMEKRLDKIDSKLDQIDTKLDGIVGVQIEQASDIKHHIKRTDDLQKLVEPLHQKHQQFMGAVKFISSIALIAAAIQALKLLFGLI